MFACWSILILVLATSLPARADDNMAELRALIAREEQRVKVLEERLAARKRAKQEAAVPEADVRQVIADYLEENPGAGMPSSVQTGYATGEGFFVRSVPSPRYGKWQDESPIPFSLGIRGALNAGYSYYKVTDDRNHLNGLVLDPPLPDMGQLAIRNARLFFSGTAFDPNLRYQIRLDGNTRALPGVVTTHLDTAQFNTEETGDTVISKVSLGNSVRLGSQTFIAYDLHPCCAEKGCGLECPEGSVPYAPTLTLITGELNTLLGLEAYLGSTTGAVIERGIAGSFFNIPSAASAGIQGKAFEDRFFMQAVVANVFEGTTPNENLGHLPGGNVGFWYDFGGTWNESRKKWDLFGITLVDVDYSPQPAIRVGGGVAIEPLDSRQLYGDDQSSQIRVVPGGPLSTRLTALLDGTERSTLFTLDPFALNTFDDITYSAYVAGKYRGANFIVENWFRNLTNLTALNHDQIIYQPVSGGPLALYPMGHNLFDFGQTIQAGYFLVPHKFMVGARWSWIRGDSGNVYGNGGPPSVVTVRGVNQPVNVYPEAFRHFAQANEYTVSFAIFFRGNSLKWQNDIGRYTGGNPAGGRSSAGYVPGADGWLFRTRLQLLF